MGILRIFTVLLSLYRLSESFNLDVDIPVYKYGVKGSYFGYSVAQHLKTDADGSHTPILLIGAPKGDSGQFNTTRAGAIFSCGVNTVQHVGSRGGLEWCSRLNVEYPTPDEESEDYYKKDPNEAPNDITDKNGQWLGFSLSSSGTPTSEALACAPFTIFDRRARYQPGICYRLNNDLSPGKFPQPICMRPEQGKVGRHNAYGKCLEGMASVVSERHSVLATGLPGAVDWIGGIYASDYLIQAGRGKSDQFRTTASVAGDAAAEKNIAKNSYLGFSIGVGIFGFPHEKNATVSTAAPGRPSRTNAAVTTLVSGAPRYDGRENNTGGVFFLPFKHDNSDEKQMSLTEDRYRLLGDELLGSSFGYALAVVDINQDGFDDLVVGAPNYFNATNEDEVSGAVYVYFSKGKQQEIFSDVFHKPIRILGPAGRDVQFGASVANVGDLNKDGFADFAVGAPYYKPAGSTASGAVFIFNGALKNDFEKSNVKPSQVILASQLVGSWDGRQLESFGWSLSGSADLDHNGYPDLLVGAFKSDAVVLLRTRPVIHIVASTVDLRTIDKDSRSSDCSAGVCFSITTRLSLKKRRDTDRDFEASRRGTFKCRVEVLSYKGAAKRANFTNNRPRGEEYVYEWDCGRNLQNVENEDKTINVEIDSGNRDWLTPLLFKFTVDMVQIKPRFPVEGANLPDINGYPILDSRGRETEFSVEFDKKCGGDNKCVSDLAVSCFFDLPKDQQGVYIKNVGTNDYLNLTFHIQNLEERAYESNLYVYYDSQELERPQLDVPKEARLVNLGVFSDGLVVIDLGNPLEAHTSDVKFQLRFKLARGKTSGIGKPLKFTATSNTSSVETLKDNNECSAEVKVIKRAELKISGESHPKERLYYGGKVFGESAMNIEEDVGPLVTHRYVIENEGPWGVSNVTVIINWPYEVQSPYPHGKWALYLMEYPVMKMQKPGSAESEVKRCTILDNGDSKVNPLKLLENTKHSLDPAKSSPRLRVKRGSAINIKETQSPMSDQVLFRQKRRAVVSSEVFKQESGEEIKRVIISCKRKTAKCIRIQCVFDYIAEKRQPTIHIRSRLWNGTFVEDYPRGIDHVQIISDAHLRLDPNQGVEQNNTSDDNAEAITIAQPDTPEISRPAAIPIYIIVIAAACGIFLLFLIVIVCWRCGFFERANRRPGQQMYTAELKSGPEMMNEFDET